MSLEKKGPQALWRSKGGFTTKVHAIVSGIRDLFGFILTPWNTSDAPIWNTMIDCLLPEPETDQWKQITHLLADRWYDSDEIRELLIERGIIPVIPWRKNRKQKIEYDKVLYKRRNEIERFWLFAKYKRRFFTRYEKLDICYAGIVILTAIWFILNSL